MERTCHNSPLRQRHGKNLIHDIRVAANTHRPVLYADELRGGIRLENDYLVTNDGVELLSDFDLRL